MKKNYKILLKSKKGNYLVTIAIGKKYYNEWKTYSSQNWLKYCKLNSLGLIIFDNHLIEESNPFWKKPTWQKFLIGDFIKKNLTSIKANNICYLDTDIMINPYSPNIFDFHNNKKISVVSLRNNLPYSFMETRKKIAFLRHSYYTKKYPLDSSLFISLKDLYKFHKMKVQKDEACAGLFVFNVMNHADKFKSWFFLYKKNVKSITNNGDQTHFNFHIQNENLEHWINYKFQASWCYEMALNYPYLYQKNLCTKKNIKNAIEASLFTNFFLHFAGNWPESKMLKTKNILTKKETLKKYKFFSEYSKKKLTGKPMGQIVLN